MLKIWHKPLHRRGGCFFYDIFEMWCGKVMRVSPWYFSDSAVTCIACQTAHQAWWDALSAERRAGWNVILIRRKI